VVFAALSAGIAVQVDRSVLASPTEGGEIVTALDPRMRVVFQAKDGAHWFGSADQGVYRFDGKRIVRFKQEHGLGGNQVWDLQEDRSGNVYVCSYPGGISRFDGRAFSMLRVADPSKSEWKLGPEDLWFPGGQDSGAVYRYDGKDLHRLTLPKTKRGEAFIAKNPRAQFPNIKYLPYDVYTTFKDSRGHVWFGTANLGACRFDGTSFAWLAETEFGFGEYHSGGTRSIVEDKDGKLWFSKTLNRFDVRVPSATAPAERGTVAPLSYRKEPGIGDDSSPFSDFMSAVKDKNGDLLMATLGAGVWRYDGARMTQYPVKYGDSAIWVFSIYRDRQDTLWLATQEHGIYKFNGKTFEPFKP
jgi:ligand-binding sensor domain-containing protein